MGTLAFISLGSNLGDRKAQLESALAALADAPDVIVRAASSFHVTPPVGGPGGQGAFLNAAAALETSLEPTDLLSLLQSIEHRAGRVRTVRWGERPLDLDLLLYGDRRLHTSRCPVGGRDEIELIVPHPRLAVRRFVLAPLAEIAPRRDRAVHGAYGRRPAGQPRSPAEPRGPPPPLPVPRAPLLEARAQAVGRRVILRGGPRDRWTGIGKLVRSSSSRAARRELAGRDVGRSSAADGRLVRRRWTSAGALRDARNRISPTFVVAPRDSGHPPPTSVTPTLRLEADDVEAMAEEISSACQASRAGRASC